MKNHYILRILLLLLSLNGLSNQLQAQTIRYVKQGGAGSGDGSSWANASADLQSQIDVSGVEQIWVAAGVYKPTTVYGGSGQQYQTFLINKNIRIYGGFPNTGNPVFNARNWTSNPTILSGEIGSASATDNCYHVVYMYRLATTALLDGFTISDGYSVFDGGAGGGIYVDGSGSANQSNPAISNCLFTNNASEEGGGLYNDGTNGGQASPILTNCQFITNSTGSTGSGAGAFNDGSNGGNSSPTFIQCVFKGNTADFNSGAVNNHGLSGTCSPTYINCLFSGNYAANNGGVMVNEGGSGGNCTPSIVNCTFSGNNAPNLGGIMRNNTAFPTIKNSILWGNNTGINENGGSTTITFSITQDGQPGTGNINTNPVFITPVAFSAAPTTSGDLHLQSSSPAINAGTNTGAPSNDLDGNTRPFNGGTSDIGAYESSFQNIFITDFSATPNPVCVGNPVTFTATVGNVTTPYAFTLSNGTSTTTGNTSSTAFSQSLVTGGSSPQTYTLTVSSGGQMTTATTSLTVNALPVATVTLSNGGTLTCAQTSLTISVSGGSYYAFARQGGGGITSVSGQFPTICSVTALQWLIWRGFIQSLPQWAARVVRV